MPTLGVHILGAGFGESIVLQLPGGTFGVVDCFSPVVRAGSREERLAANPTLRFLVNDLNARSLEFVALTHPHEDHGRGLSHLLEEYRGRIGRFWMFHGYQSIHLERYFFALLKTGRRLPSTPPLAGVPGHFAVELSHIRNAVVRQTGPTDPASAGFDSLVGPKALQVDGGRVTVRVLGPTDKLANAYEARLADHMADAVRPDATGVVVDPVWRPEAVNHNDVSPALLIEFGATRVLLGGDMEEPAWRQTLTDHPAAGGADPLACQLLKVSHHGSLAGFTDEACGRCGGRRPVAVVTPYNRNQSPLPNHSGLDRLMRFVPEVLTTNVGEARRSVVRSAVHSDGPLPPAVAALVPRAWRAEPATLHPKVSGSEADAPDALPAGWWKDLEARPWLIELLHPDLRRAVDRRVPPGSAESDCRLSFYFDGDGAERTADRHVGRLAGRLDWS